MCQGTNVHRTCLPRTAVVRWLVRRWGSWLLSDSGCAQQVSNMWSVGGRGPGISEAGLGRNEAQAPFATCWQVPGTTTGHSIILLSFGGQSSRSLLSHLSRLCQLHKHKGSIRMRSLPTSGPSRHIISQRFSKRSSSTETSLRQVQLAHRHVWRRSKARLTKTADTL